MTISAKVIAHSISPLHNTPVITLQLRYPKFIHSEFMTHRVFSRNASSSRAIPVERLIADIIRDPVTPSYWGSNKPGMQAGKEINTPVTMKYRGNDHPFPRDAAWLQAMQNAIDAARAFDKAGYHKQIVNRILEPFSHINVVVTATDWDNFFELRCHPDAQPEMRILACEMRDAITRSVPRRIDVDDWHTPYVDDQEVDSDTRIKLSVARCARVSYLTHDGKVPAPEEDLRLYDHLVASVPMHASPAEHQCSPVNNPDFCANLRGWMQCRRVLELSHNIAA